MAEPREQPEEPPVPADVPPLPRVLENAPNPRRRAAVLFFGFVGAIFLIVVLVVQSDWFGRWLRDRVVEPQLRASLYSVVHIGSLKVRLVSLQPRVELEDLSIRPKTPGDKQEFKDPTITLDRARVVFRPLQLMGGRIDVEQVELDGPHADLSMKDGKIHGLPLPLVDDVDYSGAKSEESPIKLRLDAILVKRGTLHFDADEPDLEVGLTNVKALATLENDSVVIDMESEGRRLHLREGDADLEERLDAIRGQILVRGKKVELRDAHAEIGDVVADGDGVVSLAKGPLDVDFSTLRVSAPLTLVREFVHSTPEMRGEIAWNGGVGIKGKSVRARGNAKIDDFWLDKFHFGRTEADVDMAGRKATARRLVIDGMGGRIEGAAEMSWPGDSLRLKTDVDVQNASFAQVLDAVGVDGSHVDARLDGHVAFDGPVDDHFDLIGTAELSQHDFAWTTKGWNQAGPRRTNLAVLPGSVAGAFEVKHSGIHFENIAATAGTAKLELDGDLFFKGAADLSFTADPIDLAEVSPVGAVALAGRGPASGRVHGPLDALVIEANLDLDGVKVGGFDFGRGTGPIRFEDLVLSSEGTTFTRGKSTYAGPWKVDFHDPVSLAFAVDAKGARVEDLADIVWGDMPASAYVRGGPIDGHIQLYGPLDALTGGYKVAGREVVVKGERFAKLAADGRWKSGTIWLDDLVAQKPSGATVYARGSLEPAKTEPELGGVVNLEAHTAKMSLADLDSVGPDSSVQSDLGLRVHVGGRFSRPDVRGRLDLSNTRFRGSPLGAGQLDFKTVVNPETGVAEILEVGGQLAGGTVKATSEVKLWRTALLPYWAKFEVTKHSIKPYLYVLNERLSRDDEFAALASGKIAASGKVLDIGNSRLDVLVDDLAINRGPHTLTNHEPIDLSFGGGIVDIRDFSLKGDETHFHLHGTQDVDGNLNFAADGDIDLAFYELIDSANAFSRVEGVLHVPSLVVNGTTKDPIVLGRADLDRAVFKTRFFNEEIEDVRGSIRFSQDEVVFEDSLTGKFGGGAFEGKGSMRLSGASVKSWDLHARVTDAKVRFPAAALSATVTGPLDFTGPSSNPVLSGDLAMSEMRFQKSFDWKAMAVTFNRGHDVITAPDESAKLFDLDIKLHADDNMVVMNELAPHGIEFRTVPGDPLDIVGNSAQWGMLGSIELVRGAGHAANKVTFQGHEFTIGNGLINFLSRDQLDFHYKFSDAETVIKDWTITANVEGYFLRGQTSYDFSSIPPLPPEDINMLLVAGVTRQEASAADRDAAVLGGIAASVVGQGLADQRGLGKIKSFIPVDSYEIVPTQTLGGQMGLKFVMKTQLTPKLELQGDVMVGNSGRGKAYLDYRVNKMLHVTGGWTNEQDQTDTQTVNSPQGDLGADAKFRFEWK